MEEESLVALDGLELGFQIFDFSAHDGEGRLHVLEKTHGVVSVLGCTVLALNGMTFEAVAGALELGVVFFVHRENGVYGVYGLW